MYLLIRWIGRSIPVEVEFFFVSKSSFGRGIEPLTILRLSV